MSIRVRYVPDPRRIEVVDEAVAAILRAKTPWERLELAAESNLAARELIAGHLMDIHPDWTPAEIQSEVVRRMTRADH